MPETPDDLHCWADSGDGKTCLLDPGHSGPHEWSYDEFIPVSFAPQPQAPAITEVPIPDELWMLANADEWISSIDDAPGGATYLVCFCQEEAETAAKYQNALYGTECVAVRVK